MPDSDAIGPGLILVLGGTNLPPSLREDSDRPFPEWNTRKGLTEEDLRKRLESAGWLLYRVGKKITATVFAATPEEGTQKAMERLRKVVTARNCNCFQIVDTQVRGIKGLRHVSLDAHAHHIQKGIGKF